MSFYMPPMKVGEYTTSTVQSGDLGNVYRMDSGVFRWVTNSAAITNAGGKVVVHSLTNGAITGTVVESVTVADLTKVAGVIPIGTSGQGNAIALTTTLAAGSYFLLQLSGASQIQANTVITAGATLVVGTVTSGVSASMATGVEGAFAVNANLGYTTNTAVATAAGQLIPCVLPRVA